ncbi:signal peptidase I [Canicola haemoglobinophilus]|uniref:Signal peptidase I n=1 Tax=Canicola haemoglobinophilus TaxID=733 RepID=A0AB38H7Y6_9PAST|nr:signal peptidase I [Canicola haemoglobinophilus]STO55511.1 signal peptidase I [Canicola haemoglobinophilus]STO67838.1 signal peptidase I [Canicola haemoglobinophilus]
MSKSNLSFIALIVIGFIAWKILDFFALPNTFTILLILLTALCGVLWCYHRFVVLPKRARQITRQEQRSGKQLSDEEKAQIEPISETSEMLSSLFPVLAFVLILRSFLFEPFQIPSVSMEPTLRVGDFLLVKKYAYGIKDPVFQNTIIETGKPQRGDIIVFKAPQEPNIDYIKRVVGISGDRVFYDEKTRHVSIIYNKDGKECTYDCQVHEFTYSEPQSNPDFTMIVGRDSQGKAQYGEENPLVLTEKGDVEHQIHWDPQVFNRTYMYSGYRQQKDYVTEWVVPEGQYFVLGDNRDQSADGRFWGFVPEKNIVGKAEFIWLSLDKKQDEFPKGIRFSRMFSSIQ